MNPFFLFLFVCAFAAIIYWFKSASKQQGITALKGAFILLGLIIIVLAVTGRIPIVAGIVIVLLGIFKKFALQQLLIPLIKILAGQYVSKKLKPKKISMDTQKALNLLSLSNNPTREQIVQAHRTKIRELEDNNTQKTSQIELLDAARAHLIDLSNAGE